MKVTNRDILNGIVANTGRFVLVADSFDFDKDQRLAQLIINKDDMAAGYNLPDPHINAIPLQEISQDTTTDKTLISAGYALYFDEKLLLGKRPSNITHPNKWTVMSGRCSELPSETGIKEALEEVVVEVTNGTEFGFAYFGSSEEYHLAIAETALSNVDYDDRARAAKWIHCELETISTNNEYRVEIYDEQCGLLDVVSDVTLSFCDKRITLDMVTEKRVVMPEGWRFSRAWFIENDETQEAKLLSVDQWHEVERSEMTNCVLSIID